MIEKVRARNFLSLKNVDLELGETNLLVGPNMSGKSNLVDCFRFLRTTATAGLSQAFVDRDGFQEVVSKSGAEQRISLSLSITLPGQDAADDHYIYDIAILGNRLGSFSIDSETLVWRQGDRQQQLVNLHSGQGTIYGEEGEVAFSVPADPTKSVLEYNVPGWKGTQFKEYLSQFCFFHFVPQSMREPNPAAGQRVLVENGGNLSSWLLTIHNQHPSDFTRIRRVARDVFAGLDEILTPVNQLGTTYLSSREKGLSSEVNLRKMSDGELCFIALLSLIFAPVELGASLYCLEEPENHLHPSLLGTLVDVLKQRRLELGRNAGQIIATTHSPYLVDKVSLDELIVTQKVNAETIFIHPSTDGHVRELLSHEELGLGELWFSGVLNRP